MSIFLHQVTKSYGDKKAVNNLSLEVPAGQIVGFLGPNGAGKSTTMKMITGILAADHGSIEIAGINLAVNPIDAKKKVGYLPENNPLYEEMYVREYLLFHAKIHSIDASEIENILQLTGLLPEAHQKIEALSKGYKQRVGLAAALLHKPEVLILDEPTTGLDPKQLVDIRKLIKNLGGERTILLSTHIMQEVEAMCDRAVIIKNGEIVADKMLQQEKEDFQVIEVEFNYRIEDVALQQIPKLKKVENPKGFTYLLYFETKEDMRSNVFDFAYDNGLKIIELKKNTQSLESLFLELTEN